MSRIKARPFDLPMKEAQEYWRGKITMDTDDFYKLSEELRGRAFTVGALARADMIHDVRKSLETALENGQSMGEWKKSLSEVIKASGWDRRRQDLIFRTNIQSAYQAGRHKQMQAAKALRPYWRYVAVQDSRTRPSHAAMHGKVFPADSPVWDTWYPNNGYQCRCSVTTLSARQVEQYGYEVETEMPGPTLVTDPRTGMETVISPLPDRGWETNQAKEYWQPDLNKYPDWMREKLEAMGVGEVVGAVVKAPPVPAAPGVQEGRLPSVIPYTDFKDKKEAINWAEKKLIGEKVLPAHLSRFTDADKGGFNIKDLPTGSINEINRGLNDSIGIYGIKISEIKQMKGKKRTNAIFYSHDSQPHGWMEVSYQYAKNAKKKAGEVHASHMARNKEHIEYYRKAADDPARAMLREQNLIKMKLHETVERWSMSSSASNPLHSTIVHEGAHAIDFQYGIRGKFTEAMKRRGVTVYEKFKVSEYGASKDSELFAEVFAAVSTGRAAVVPDNILASFYEVMSKIGVD